MLCTFRRHNVDSRFHKIQTSNVHILFDILYTVFTYWSTNQETQQKFAASRKASAIQPAAVTRPPTTITRWPPNAMTTQHGECEQQKNAGEHEFASTPCIAEDRAALESRVKMSDQQ